MTFATFSFAQLFHTFNLRSEESLFEIGFFTNNYLVGGVAISILLQLAVLLISPLRVIFEVVSLDVLDWSIVAGLSIVLIIVMELIKRFR
jgi:Ca2+-transporting ATPase